MDWGMLIPGYLSFSAVWGGCCARGRAHSVSHNVKEQLQFHAHEKLRFAEACSAPVVLAHDFQNCFTGQRRQRIGANSYPLTPNRCEIFPCDLFDVFLFSLTGLRPVPVFKRLLLEFCARWLFIPRFLKTYSRIKSSRRPGLPRAATRCRTLQHAAKKNAQTGLTHFCQPPRLKPET
jgi:hypothetical protein